MTMWGIRSTVVTATAVLLALPLAGCGAGSSAMSKATATKSSAATTQSSADATTVGLTPKVGSTVSEAQLETQTHRVIDGRSVHVTKLTGPRRSVLESGVVSYGADSNYAATMTERIAGERASVVYAGGVMYLKLPAEWAGWIAIRQGGTDPISKESAPLLAAIKQAASGQVLGVPGVAWRVTAVTGSTVTYRTHLTQTEVQAEVTKLGLGSLARVPATGEDITQVTSLSGLPQDAEVSVDGSMIETRYTGWGPAITISAPNGAVSPPAT